jgi:hypothetical protein
MITTKRYDYDKTSLAGVSFTTGEEKTYTYTFDFNIESIISLTLSTSKISDWLSIKSWTITNNSVSIVLKNNYSVTRVTTGLLFCSVSGVYE